MSEVAPRLGRLLRVLPGCVVAPLWNAKRVRSFFLDRPAPADERSRIYENPCHMDDFAQ